MWEGDMLAQERDAARLAKLIEVGIALSAERDHARLMERILVEAQALCEALSPTVARSTAHRSADGGTPAHRGRTGDAPGTQALCDADGGTLYLRTGDAGPVRRRRWHALPAHRGRWDGRLPPTASRCAKVVSHSTP